MSPTVRPSSNILPSFLELLASLNLEREENSELQPNALYLTSPSFVTSSPSSSLPSLSSRHVSPGKFLTTPEESATSFTFHSPFIVTSHPLPVDSTNPSRGRNISNRYTPYVLPKAFTRRRSLPGDLMNHPDHVQQWLEFRASSSPPMSRAFLGNPSAKSSTHQPISAFVRRRFPNGSRTQSPEFRKMTSRSVSPSDALTPLSLPSLPPLPWISAEINSPPSLGLFSNSSPSVSILDHNSTTTSEHQNIRLRASQTPTPVPPTPMTTEDTQF